MAKKKPHTDSSANGAMQPEQADPQPAYFLSMSLKNVRCFTEEQTLDLSDGHGKPARWTILLGNNGTGKTTVLQALGLLSEVVTPWRAAQNMSPLYMLGFLFPPLWLVNMHLDAALPDRVGRRFARVPNLQWAFSTVFSRGPMVADTESQLEPIRITIAQDERPPDGTLIKNPPACYGYPATRRAGATAFMTGAPSLATESLFSDHVDLVDAEEWLLRLDYSIKASNQQAEQKKRLDQVKTLLVGILPEVQDFRFVVGTGVNPTSRVEFSTPYGWVPLRQLGYGYQTLIAWMVDLASRMMERYPDSPNPLAEPAVVLVDEIDLHLHPTWQRQLIGHLTKNFPNTQFIVTAHSPLVVQAAPAEANIAVLRREGDHVVIDNDAKAIRGWRIDQLLTSDLFGLPTARPPQFDDLLKRRTELRSKARLTAEEKRDLARVEAEIGDLPFGETAEQAHTLQLLHESLDLLKRNQKPKP